MIEPRTIIVDFAVLGGFAGAWIKDSQWVYEYSCSVIPIRNGKELNESDLAVLRNMGFAPNFKTQFEFPPGSPPSASEVAQAMLAWTQGEPMTEAASLVGKTIPLGDQ